MATAKKHKRSCSECGVGLEPGLTSCPLCGAEQRTPPGSLITEQGTYQAKVRKLRDELRRLRADGAA
ncbi:MAG: hypothetical protein JJE05_09140 [Actinobacteria bacterium]|nr:hypothetical protein [Actinomycetota bacterium]